MTIATPGPEAAAPGPELLAEPAAGSAAAGDSRFPWKAKGTRKPLPPWDRVKFLVLLAVVFGLLAWNEYLRIRPLGSLSEAASNELRVETWLPVLFGLEIVRQVHFAISERSARYNRLWADRIFGRTTRWYEKRFSPWTRYRMARVTKWVVVLVLVAVVLGRYLNTTPLLAVFQAPALLVQALPMAFQIVFILAISVLQFAAIFWFMSRGGVETYFPDDIETRFSDVWGQDHVVERIKENMVLLEDPESIEAKGGHVPSGILLWGPPGTGKTLMAEAVAGETGKPYVFVDPGAFQNMFFGVGILKVKALFRKLRKLALRYGGVIVFFDEADSLGSRGGVVGGAAGGYATPAPWQNSGGWQQPVPWHAASCNGFGHLSSHGRHLVAQSALGLQDAADEPVPRGGLRERVVGMPVNGGMGGGGGMGTLQALLTELSGLKKPRGFLNRVVRRTLGMRPKPPPKFRILVMMATNLPDALDPALLRPGRIDRTYRVGYPSKAGRLRTYEGYLGKVKHDLTPEQVDKLATITPYATGATIKDLVNEALIYAIREEREVVTWKDFVKAKHLKDLGPSEDVEYIERERHAVAVHEACHALLAWQTRRHMEIDLATIEKGSTYLGMVASIPPEDQFTRWRSEYESDILVSLASLAGERLFYGGDNSSGVSGDLRSATTIAALMESHWGMGAGVSSLPALQDFGINGGTPQDKRKGGGIGFGAELSAKKDDPTGGGLGQRIETGLAKYLQDAEQVLRTHRGAVLALAHALESHKTLTGEDVVAVLEGRPGPLVDGRPYTDPAFIAELERYHESAVEAHRQHAPVQLRLPQVTTLRGELVDDGSPEDARRAAATLGWAVGATEAPTAAEPGAGPGPTAG